MGQGPVRSTLRRDLGQGVGSLGGMLPQDVPVPGQAAGRVLRDIDRDVRQPSGRDLAIHHRGKVM